MVNPRNRLDAARFTGCSLAGALQNIDTLMILIYDEPTAQADNTRELEMMAAIRTGWNQQTRTTISETLSEPPAIRA